MQSLPVLPEIDFVETDAQPIIDSIIGGYETIAGRRLSQADPVRLFLLSIAYIIVQQRQQINAAGKSNTLYYAQGDYLDHIGAFRDLVRHPAQGAVTTVRFTLSAPQPGVIGIPQGTRVTADGNLFFATTEPGQILAGQSSVDIPVRALTPGSASNEIPAGEINTLVDPIAFVARVRSLEETQGGHDAESDGAFRQRIYEAPAAFSTAGPVEAYAYWARTASGAIVDVVAHSPSPGVAEIRPLLRGGIIPDQTILDAVEAALTPTHIRPLTDSVQVLAPDPVEYTINITYYIRRADQASLAAIQERVQEAINSYINWQRGKLGRDINPDELIALVKAAGAKRLEVDSPIYTPIEPTCVAQEVDVVVTYGGVEGE